MEPNAPLESSSVASFRHPLPDHVYSNFDHELDAEVVRLLELGCNFAFHDAWNFQARVYKAGGMWYSEVWQHHKIVALIDGDSVETVIEEANKGFGYG